MAENLTLDNGAQEKICPRCGGTFFCGAQAGTTCWCAVSPRLTFIDPSLPDCLCPTCLNAALLAQGQAPTSE